MLYFTRFDFSFVSLRAKKVWGGWGVGSKKGRWVDVCLCIDGSINSA